MLTRLLAPAFKSNSHTRNSICFGYVDMDTNTCKFKESGQFYYSVTQENTGPMLFINTNCWLLCWDPRKTEQIAITCLSSTEVPPNRSAETWVFISVYFYLFPIVKVGMLQNHCHYLSLTLTRRHYLYYSSQKEKQGKNDCNHHHPRREGEGRGGSRHADALGFLRGAGYHPATGLHSQGYRAGEGRGGPGVNPWFGCKARAEPECLPLWWRHGTPDIRRGAGHGCWQHSVSNRLSQLAWILKREENDFNKEITCWDF